MGGARHRATTTSPAPLDHPRESISSIPTPRLSPTTRPHIPQLTLRSYQNTRIEAPHHVPLPTTTPSQPNQTLTKVDTRLARADKTYHCQLPTPAKHDTIATTPTIPTPPSSTLAVNSSGTSRKNLNTILAHSQPPTPHLTSPLRGGRDELGPSSSSLPSPRERDQIRGDECAGTTGAASSYNTPSQSARSSARQSYSTRMSSPKTSCARCSES